MPKIPIEVEAEQSLEQLRDLSRRIRESSNESSNFLSELKKLRNAYKDLNYSQVQELENYKKLSSSRENYQKKTEALRYEVKKITSQYSEWMDATRSPSKGIEQMISLLDKINVSSKLSDLGKIVKPTGSSSSSFRSPETDAIISKYSGTSFQHMIDANAKKFSSSSIVKSAEELKEDLNNITMDFFKETFDSVEDMSSGDIFKDIIDQSKKVLELQEQEAEAQKADEQKKAEEDEIARTNKMKTALMGKIRSFKFYLGLTMMFYNLTKKILGNTQVLSKAWNMVGSAFGFILDMVFLPLLPIIMTIVKALFWVGQRIHDIMVAAHNLHPWLDKIFSLFLLITGALIISKLTGIGTIFLEWSSLLGVAGVAGKLEILYGLLGLVGNLLANIAVGTGIGLLVLAFLDLIGVTDWFSDVARNLRKEWGLNFDDLIMGANLFGDALNYIGDLYNDTIGALTGSKILTLKARNELLSEGTFSKDFLDELHINNPNIEYYNPDNFGTKAGYYDTGGGMPSADNRITSYSQVSTYQTNNNTNIPSKSASIDLNRTAGLAQ